MKLIYLEEQIFYKKSFIFLYSISLSLNEPKDL